MAEFLPALRRDFPIAEIIVVNDGSTDTTVAVCEENKVKVVSHQYSRGNGAAIKSGARAARGKILAFMDADGQHSVENLRSMLDLYTSEGHDMVVGARSGIKSQASKRRWAANNFYNRFASYVVGHEIPDLTSGLRVVNAKKFKQFLFMLPNGFSYPTTITMAFFRAGYSVAYLPFEAARRIGKSHLKIVQDGFRFLLIIFKLATLYSPLKIFAPTALVTFLCGFSYYIYTYIHVGRLTNMTVILFMMSVLVFLIGLVSEQITTLLYRESADDDD